MTALDRAIADPPRVPGVVRHSPLAGLDRRSLGFADVVSQSLSATAPAAAATTIPMLVASQSGPGTLWSVAGALVLSLLVATTINQFTRRMSAAGSLYTFVSKGLGTVFGFITGVCMLLAYGVLAMFALAGSAIYIAAILRFAWPDIRSTPIAGNLLVALIVVGLAAGVFGVLARGIRMSARLTLLIESASITLILGLVVALAIASASVGDTGRAMTAAMAPPSTGGDFTIAVVIGMMAFVGFESAASVGVEAKRPFARIPRAITWTVVGSGALYLLSTYSQLVGFSAIGSSLSTSAAPVTELARAFGVEWVGLVLDVSIAGSFIACAAASLTALIRMVFAMSRDGLLPDGLSVTHPRLGTPLVALSWLVPAIVALSVVVPICTPDAASALDLLLVALASAFLAAYALVCVAAFAFLRRIGELGLWSGVIALGTGAALLGALGIYLVVQFTGSGAAGVTVFAITLLSGAFTFPLLKHRHPWITSSMGQFDETTVRDVLGGNQVGDSSPEQYPPSPGSSGNHGA